VLSVSRWYEGLTATSWHQHDGAPRHLGRRRAVGLPDAGGRRSQPAAPHLQGKSRGLRWRRFQGRYPSPFRPIPRPAIDLYSTQLEWRHGPGARDSLVGVRIDARNGPAEMLGVCPPFDYYLQIASLKTNPCFRIFYTCLRYDGKTWKKCNLVILEDIPYHIQ